MNKHSETNWAQVDALTDDTIDTSDIPPLTDRDFVRMTLRPSRISKGGANRAKALSVEEVVEEIFQAVLATPKRQRRLLSKTFWDKFGFKVRTKERISQVAAELKRRGLAINLDASVFGTEAKDEWIILTYLEQYDAPELGEKAPVDHVPTPSHVWFEQLQQRIFESEREVEYYFILPLVEQLGYIEDDCVIGHPMQIFQGTKKVNPVADVVLFNGKQRDKDNALVVIEAKKRKLTEDAIGQARSYAQALTTPYYLVTNGEQLRVYRFQGALVADVKLMDFKRTELEQEWGSLYQLLNKSAVLERKKRLQQLLREVYS
jgi:hypothetical protein